jgi:glyoxylase-like metal-dependent hydrolase (beta-lactamase superfamily II)
MLHVGDLQISRIEETLLREPSNVFAEWDPALADRHGDVLTPSVYDRATDTFTVSVHSWLVRTPRRTIVIDTSGGNHKPRPASPRFDHFNFPFLERLAAAGVSPEAVDMVINTHLHVDHVGWNTRLKAGEWIPTFPNARYFLPRIERDLRDPERGAKARPPETALPFLDSVKPILDAGLATLVAGDEALGDGIALMPAPGHTPGQFAVRLRSAGAEALFIADVMHQPIQVLYPHWNSKYCEDAELARATRRRLLAHSAEHRSLILPGHFGAPHCGWVERDGAGFAFRASPHLP